MSQQSLRNQNQPSDQRQNRGGGGGDGGGNGGSSHNHSHRSGGGSSRNNLPPPRIHGLVDSHVHLAYADSSDELDQVMAAWRETGVVQMVHACVEPTAEFVMMEQLRSASPSCIWLLVCIRVKFQDIGTKLDWIK